MEWLGQEGGMTRGPREIWGWRVCSLTWFGDAFTGVDICQSRPVVHIKYTQFILCQLYFNKVVFKNLTHLEWEGDVEMFLNTWLSQKPWIQLPCKARGGWAPGWGDLFLRSLLTSTTTAVWEQFSLQTNLGSSSYVCPQILREGKWSDLFKATQLVDCKVLHHPQVSRVWPLLHYQSWHRTKMPLRIVGWVCWKSPVTYPWDLAGVWRRWSLLPLLMGAASSPVFCVPIPISVPPVLLSLLCTLCLAGCWERPMGRAWDGHGVTWAWGRASVVPWLCIRELEEEDFYLALASLSRLGWRRTAFLRKSHTRSDLGYPSFLQERETKRTTYMDRRPNHALSMQGWDPGLRTSGGFRALSGISVKLNT